MEVIVDGYGLYLGKKSERFVIKKGKDVLEEHPLMNIERVTITSMGVSISTDLLKECTERGIMINLLSWGGKPYAMITSPHLTGTVITRREQFRAYDDHRGIEYGRAIVTGKIKNQINTLKYSSKYRKQSAPGVYKLIYEKISKMNEIMSEAFKVTGKNIDEVRGTLLSIEGRASQYYWQCIKEILDEDIDFPGREHRGATDPVNSLLNYGYGILCSRIWGALLLAGLEPYCGFIHVDRPGKASLVYDAVEEFRQPVVDRVVLAFINRKGQVEIDKEGMLEEKCKKNFAGKIIERLDAQERYDGKKYTIKTIIQRQTRKLASFLRNEGKFEPFICSW